MWPHLMNLYRLLIAIFSQIQYKEAQKGVNDRNTLFPNEGKTEGRLSSFQPN